jgi:hypothetical protein
MGVGCCTGLGWDSSGFFFLFARRVFSAAALAAFFFFLLEVSPAMPSGADCVC